MTLLEEKKDTMQKLENKLTNDQDCEYDPEVRKKAFFDRFLRMYKNIFVMTVTSATTRTPHCKHKIGSCYMHALDGFIRDFL